MNKEDIILKMARDTGISRTQATRALRSVISGIENALNRGRKVTLAGFGSFQVMRRKERKGRNPQTGEVIHIPSAKAVKFSPSKKLKEAVK